MNEVGKDGLWSFWNEEGLLAEQGEFNDGQRVGLHTYWDDEGKKLFEIEGGAEWTTEEWTTVDLWGGDGTRYVASGFQNQAGQRVGLWTYWHKNGKKLFEIEGGAEWTTEEWTIAALGSGDGTRYVASGFQNQAGQQEGLWTTWHDNGQKCEEGEYKDGKKEGLWTGWYDNGQKWEEGECKDGKKEGLWTTWYYNGQKWDEGEYKDGKKEGLETTWLSNGQKKREVEYKDGEEVSRTDF